MKTNVSQRKVKIISEIHPQHLGSMDESKERYCNQKLEELIL